MSKPAKFARASVVFAALSLPLGATVGHAQTIQPASPTAVSPTVAVPVTIPAMTPVIVEILTALSTKTSKAGDTFALRLATPISIDGQVVVPAGTIGEGEILDSKRGGMSGSSGILMLIAHDLKVAGRSLRLRSMQVAQAGSDHDMEAHIAAALVGPLGLLITGGDAVIPAGTYAGAKTAEDFTLTLAPEPTQANTPALTPTPTLPSALSTTTGTKP